MSKEKSEEIKKLEALDKQYGKDKSEHQTLEADKVTTKRLTLAVLDAQDKLNSMKRENERASIIGQKVPHDKDILDKADEDVKKAVKDLEVHKKKLIDALDKVNTRFEELQKNPAIKQQLDSILAKRMERSIKKKQNDIENYKKVQEIFDKHPHAKNLLKGMIKNRKEMQRLDKIIEEIESKSENTRTNEEKQKLQDAKKQYAIAENKCGGRELDIQEFLKNQYPDLSLEVEKIIFDLNTVRIDKIIKGAEKDINNRKHAYKELTGKEYEVPAQEEKQKESVQETKGSKTEVLLPAKINRWQKFKSWLRNAWNGVKTAVTGEEEKTKAETKQKAGSEFREAYKYDIVKDYVAQKEHELLKNKTAKNRDDKDRDSKDSR